MIKIENLPTTLRRNGKRNLKEKLLKLCEDNDIAFMAIFGSFVRGEERKKSDIDIAVEFAKESHKSLFDLMQVEDQLRKIFGRKVDLGIFSTLHPYIIEDVQKEMKVIYEKR